MQDSSPTSPSKFPPILLPIGETHGLKGFVCLPLQNYPLDMKRDCPHKKWRDAVPDLPDPFVELPGKLEGIRKRSEALELRKRKSSPLIPMHRPVHAEIPVIPADRPRWPAGIELDAVESGPGDVLLRPVDPDLVVILERSVAQACVKQFRKLILRSRDAFQRVAASHRFG
jgi:hypothetical protein